MGDKDGMTNVCHRGPANASNPSTGATPDLGLGVAGEGSCARCGIHLGDYFNDDEDGKDHYCINGVCMIPPGQPDGTTCSPNLEDVSVYVFSRDLGSSISVLHCFALLGAV